MHGAYGPSLPGPAAAPCCALRCGPAARQYIRALRTLQRPCLYLRYYQAPRRRGGMLAMPSEDGLRLTRCGARWRQVLLGALDALALLRGQRGQLALDAAAGIRLLNAPVVAQRQVRLTVGWHLLLHGVMGQR